MKRGPGFILNVWHLLGLGFWHFIFKWLNRVEVVGGEHIPKRGEEGVMLLYNHISAVDPFLVGATAMPFFSPVWWRAPAKEELFNIPIIRGILASWGAFPVRRGKRDLESIRKMVEMLSHSVVVIAPEGKRSDDGQLQRGRAGVGKILHEARPQKVIPVRMRGVETILPRGTILPRLGRRTTITYGPPIDLTHYYNLPDSVETSQQIVDFVMQEIAKL
ncbi:MAG: 1-acyl-sn-glycerol-3-phosphate acyltransferase [Nitrospirae bacterium]|nr:1-acyl-sn-glycerol-3-phosphate acyltransferase [Candidatus Manganitrophaceae bacterium]